MNSVKQYFSFYFFALSISASLALSSCGSEKTTEDKPAASAEVEKPRAFRESRDENSVKPVDTFSHPNAADAKPFGDTPPKPSEFFQVRPGRYVGYIDGITDRAQMVEWFGADNITERVVQVNPKQWVTATILYAGTPKELEILWQDTIKKRLPRRVTTAKVGSPWKTKTGLAIGTTMADAAKGNGADISMFGLGWDYEGTVTSWNGGVFEKEHPARSLFFLKFTYNKAAYKALTPNEKKSITTKEKILSSNVALQKVNPTIEKMEFFFSPK